MKQRVESGVAFQASTHGARVAPKRMRDLVSLLAPVAFFALVALGSPGEARAYECLRFGCPAWCSPVPVNVGELSADLEAIAPGTTLSTAEQAFGDWARLSCVALDVEVRETASLAAPVFGDGQSDFAFVNEGWPYDANAIGISDVQVVAGCIREADTVLNGVNFNWVLGAGDAGDVNAYGVILHEAGHYLGLGHSREPRSVMWFLYRGGRPVLEQDDIDGICELYPGSPMGFDCTQSGCPLGYACEGTACVRTGAPGCVRHEDCGADQRCDAVSGACVAGAPSGDALGAPCVDDLDCLSGLCAQLPTGNVCTEACDGLQPRSVACPAGFICNGDAVGVCGTGLCLAGRPGDASLGAPCEEDSDCASSMCDQQVCATPCDPALIGGCPNGFVCEPGQAAACGACKPPLALGARCRFNEDCSDGFCVTNVNAETGACARQCDASTPCPEGFLCDAMGELALCVAEPLSGGTRGGAGCAVQGRASSSEAALWLGLLVLVGLRAGRRRRPIAA